MSRVNLKGHFHNHNSVKATQQMLKENTKTNSFTLLIVKVNFWYQKCIKFQNFDKFQITYSKAIICSIMYAKKKNCDTEIGTDIYKQLWESIWNFDFNDKSNNLLHFWVAMVVRVYKTTPLNACLVFHILLDIKKT